MIFGSYYLADSAKADYVARAIVTEAIIGFSQYSSCITEKEKRFVNENCEYTESEFYSVDFSEYALVDFNFKTQKYDTSISKTVNGSIKLSVNKENNSQTIKCVNISMKNQFLPSLCKEG